MTRKVRHCGRSILLSILINGAAAPTMTCERGGQRPEEPLRSQLKHSQFVRIASRFICGAKLSMRRTADKVRLRLAEKRAIGMGSDKKALLVLSVLIILLLVTATGVIAFWTSGFTLKFRSAGGKDKAAICTIKCEPKAGVPACVARCTQDGKVCDNGIRNCD